MGIKDKYTVCPVQKWECKDWLLQKHYAQRLPSISYAFGLYDAIDLIGIMTIGKPASPFICKGVCGNDVAPFVYELNRLVVQEGLPKNALSFFVGGALALVKDDLVIVSYADTAYGHHGYIYQATNWTYTGMSAKRTDAATQDNRHSRHQPCMPGAERMERSPKHRYVYFLGKRKKELRHALKYPVLPYPKGDNSRYDASYEPVTQRLLFLEKVSIRD